MYDRTVRAASTRIKDPATAPAAYRLSTPLPQGAGRRRRRRPACAGKVLPRSARPRRGSCCTSRPSPRAGFARSIYLSTITSRRSPRSDHPIERPAHLQRPQSARYARRRGHGLEGPKNKDHGWPGYREAARRDRFQEHNHDKTPPRHAPCKNRARHAPRLPQPGTLPIAPTTIGRDPGTNPKTRRQPRTEAGPRFAPPGGRSWTPPKPPTATRTRPERSFSWRHRRVTRRARSTHVARHGQPQPEDTPNPKVRPQLQSYVQQARAALPPAASPPAPLS